jgi:selenide,water dikinase
MTSNYDALTHKLTANVKAGGCAAKISSKDLQEMLSSLAKPDRAHTQLIAGPWNFEDAAVYKISEELAIVQTIDFFPPMLDDPFLFGKIAANNALSDLYAMGAKPIFALNLLSFPVCDLPLSMATEILKGGASQVELAGAVIAGGHSIQGSEVIYGLAVTGLIAPNKVLTNDGAKQNDQLILTKPVGTGIGLLGLKGDLLSKHAGQALLKNLTELNEGALKVLQRFSINALTDVTGFGLIGHLHEMAQAAGLAISLKSACVPTLPEVIALAGQGFVPHGAYANRQSYEKSVETKVEVPLALMDVFFDPQTAGGLLAAVDKSIGQEVLSALKQAGIGAAVIGEFKVGLKGAIEVTA